MQEKNYMTVATAKIMSLTDSILNDHTVCHDYFCSDYCIQWADDDK